MKLTYELIESFDKEDGSPVQVATVLRKECSDEAGNGMQRCGTCDAVYFNTNYPTCLCGATLVHVVVS